MTKEIRNIIEQLKVEESKLKKEADKLLDKIEEHYDASKDEDGSERFRIYNMEQWNRTNELLDRRLERVRKIERVIEILQTY